MITKRIIPALYVKQGQLAGAENFEGTLVELAQAYSAGGADELTFYDLAAPAGEKTLLVKALKEVAKRVNIITTSCSSCPFFKPSCKYSVVFISERIRSCSSFFPSLSSALAFFHRRVCFNFSC